MHNSKIRTGTMLMVAAILVAGTISMTVPASFAQPYYGQQQYKGYEDSYGKDYDKKKQSYDGQQQYKGYEDSYGKDYDKKKQSYYGQQQYKGYEDSYGKDYDKKKASEVNIQKVKCNNIIVNGVDKASSSPGGIMDGTADEADGAWTEDGQWLGDGQKGSNSIDKNIVNICINKNNIVEVNQDEDNVNDPCINCINEVLNNGQQNVANMNLENFCGSSAGCLQVHDEDVRSLADLCRIINQYAGSSEPVTSDEVRNLLNEVLPGGGNDQAKERRINQIIDCLISNNLIEEVVDDASDDLNQSVAQQNSTQQISTQQNIIQQNTEESNPQLAQLQELQKLQTQKLSQKLE
ncbi:MAG: hypothetical protein MRJ93_00050 [Nitrososphaeraceae archaeon]|nr:hypothetical protein [Nitrososphaeraceae archaeon]